MCSGTTCRFLIFTKVRGCGLLQNDEGSQPLTFTGLFGSFALNSDSVTKQTKVCSLALW